MSNVNFFNFIDSLIQFVVPIASLIVTFKAYKLQKSGSEIVAKINNKYDVAGSNNIIQNNLAVNEYTINLNTRLQSIQSKISSSKKEFSIIFMAMYFVVLSYFFVTHLNRHFPNIPYTSINNSSDFFDAIIIFFDYLFKNFFDFLNKIVIILLLTIISSTKLILKSSSILALMVLILSFIRTQNKITFFILSLFYLIVNLLLYMIIPSTHDFLHQTGVKSFVTFIYLFTSFICSIIILFDILKIVFSNINYNPSKDLKTYVIPLLIIIVAIFIDWVCAKEGYIFILEKLSQL